MQEKMRTDVTDSFEDMERVLEDYFRIIPSDMMFFKMENVITWDYDDHEGQIRFHFANEWSMDEFIDKMKDSPKMMTVHFEPNASECVDRENMIVSLFGKVKGLY